MIAPCPEIGNGVFLESTLAFVDCQAQSLGSAAYQSFAQPGSSLSVLVAGLVTLMVAFFGYRLLFGQVPAARDGVLAMVKVGIVLALTTSWPAFRTLAYDVAIHAPSQIAASIAAPNGLPGSDGDLASRLGNADRLLGELTRLGGVEEPATFFGATSLATGRLVFLTSTVAGYGSVRLGAGLLLALGPFFIAFLLFPGTRSLFEGWVRALVAAIVGTIAVSLLLAIELALLEPWLARLLAWRRAGYAIGGAGTELMVTSLAFGLVLLGGLAAAARLATAFRLPVRTMPTEAWGSSVPESGTSPGSAASRASEIKIPAQEHGRAAVIAEAVSSAQRRERGSLSEPSSTAARVPAQALSRDTVPGAPVPLGQSYRRTQLRTSASAGRRDRQI